MRVADRGGLGLVVPRLGDELRGDAGAEHLVRVLPVLVGPRINCSPRHQISFDSRNEGSVCVG